MAMASGEDFGELYQTINEKKVTPFRRFVLGLEGGLNASSLKSAGVTSVDIRYKLLKKGTKLYSRVVAETRMLVYYMNVATLKSVLAKNALGEDKESIACICAFELTSDVHVLQVNEDVARKLCLLWFASEEKEKAKEEEKEDGKEKTYDDYLERKHPCSKNLLDVCFASWTFHGNVKGFLFSNPSLNRETFVRAPGMDDICTTVQDFLVPVGVISRLSVDSDGFVTLAKSQVQPGKAAPAVFDAAEVDDVDGYADLRVTDVATTPHANGPQQVAPLNETLSWLTPEEYNDFQDDSLTYESIALRPSPSPRPDQPPPPPPTSNTPSSSTPEPVYGVVNKSEKRRTASVDQADTSEAKPPRPPPLDSIPIADGDSPARVAVQQKPSRPSAPPKIQRGKSVPSASSGGGGASGSTGNLSLDDDPVLPPPRGAPKAKSRKNQNDTRF